MFKKASLLSVLAIASTTTISAAFLNPVSASAVTFNAANDFSATNNPNGTWSYGYETTLGGAFNLYPNSGQRVPGLDIWINNAIAISGDPVVFHNGTSSPITFGSVTVQPGQLGFHPGPNGQYSIVRWTAPSTDSYSLATVFSGLDFVGPTSTDVHVLKNGTSLFNGEVTGFGSSSDVNFSDTFTVAIGDTIDFAVGYGTNGNYYYDSTGLDAVITSTNTPDVPEPSTIAGAVLGLVAFVGALGTCRPSFKAGRRSK